MIIHSNLELEQFIQSCVDDLNRMVAGQGLALTHPHVVEKSMELDLLILKAMRFRHRGACPV
ncbi:aspartyl-phosphate phosphatase Spo0E family protein [Paenibacillus sp. YYML68]|uniref:aspartyl-phosphate phosphatase Spo0E family protein n=1 Tax=Paenibacillus sp. YYML68 TaxID=2909250 RepID=UPI00248FB42E|nr:aspartyl-phosphate phosphatase Spo0E family protein [Paenibacillus sp. YYML68]